MNERFREATQPLLIPNTIEKQYQQISVSPKYTLLNTALRILKPWLLKENSTTEEKIICINTLLNLTDPFSKTFTDGAKIVLSRAISIAKTLSPDLIKEASLEIGLTAAKFGEPDIAKDIETYKLYPLGVSFNDHEKLENAVMEGYVKSGNIPAATKHALNLELENEAKKQGVQDATRYAHWHISPASFPLLRLAYIVERERGEEDIETKIAYLRLEDDMKRKNEFYLEKSQNRLSDLEKIAAIQIEYGKNEEAKKSLQEALGIVRSELNSSPKKDQAAHPQFWITTLGTSFAKIGAIDEVNETLKLLEQEPFEAYKPEKALEMKKNIKSKILTEAIIYFTNKGELDNAMNFLAEHLKVKKEDLQNEPSTLDFIVWDIFSKKSEAKPVSNKTFTRREKRNHVNINEDISLEQKIDEVVDHLSKNPIKTIQEAQETVNSLIELGNQSLSSKVESRVRLSTVAQNGIEVGFNNNPVIWYMGGEKRRRMNLEQTQKYVDSLSFEEQQTKFLELSKTIDDLVNKVPMKSERYLDYICEKKEGEESLKDRLFDSLPPNVVRVELINDISIEKSNKESEIIRRDKIDQLWNIPELLIYLQMLAKKTGIDSFPEIKDFSSRDNITHYNNLIQALNYTPLEESVLLHKN